MKKNSIIGIVAFLFLFTFQLTYAQSNLVDNEFGSLIKNWLDQNKDKYNLSENDLSNLIVSDAYFSSKTRIDHVYINQAHQGIKIHNAISSVAIKDRNIFYYANGLIKNITSKINTITPVINAQTAIELVVNHYNLGNASNLSIINNNNNNYLFSKGNVSQKEIPVTLVFQTTSDGFLKLAWDLSIQTLNGQNWYSVRVDAVNGQVIDTNNWITKCNFGDGNHSTHKTHNINRKETINLFKASSSMMVDGSSYNVFPIPTESPNHGSIQLITEPANATASPFGWHDTNGTNGSEFTITRGNNVWAQDDIDGNDGTGFAPDGTASLTFNFPFVGEQEPIGYLNTSVTNLFYMNNIMHDVWYQYGFDEVSGNFQQNNYGNGGSGNDFVFADAQDGSGLNNATFGTPPDGVNPGMTMFLWSATGPPGQPLTINNGALAGDYTAGTASFGTQLPSTPITSNIILVVDDNLGQPASTDTTDACNNITNAAAISGNIAILRRGACEFGAKVLAAENAGAIAVIVVNNVNGTEVINMGPGALGNQVTIPSVMVGENDGNALIMALQNGQTVNGSLVSAGPYQRDGSLDNGIIAHEYGHGISTRLSGGPSNSNCLGNAEQMGEGWSDWFALMLTIKASDVGTTGRGIGTYSTGEPTTGNGIRPFPYSIDTSVNPLTYGDTNNVNISVPHGIGTVWATILWDLTWKYIDKYGFSTDIYNGDGGNNKIMQLVLDGLKLQPCGAGFVSGRDGLIMADAATTGGVDACMIWEVFSSRGVGLNASQGGEASRLDQVEDFTEPPTTHPDVQNCQALSIDEFKLESQYSIFPNPANNEINIVTKKNFGEVEITLTDVNGRRVFSKSTRLLDEVKFNISTLQSGLYILTIKGENISTNDKIIKN